METNYKGNSRCIRSWPKWARELVRSGDIPYPLLDHVSFNTKRRELYLEPYSAYGHELQELANYCESHNLGFMITGKSPYYPGVSLLVRIRKRGDFDLETLEDILGQLPRPQGTGLEKASNGGTE